MRLVPRGIFDDSIFYNHVLHGTLVADIAEETLIIVAAVDTDAFNHLFMTVEDTVERMIGGADGGVIAKFFVYGFDESF